MKTLSFIIAALCGAVLLQAVQIARLQQDVENAKKREFSLQRKNDSNKRVLAALSQRVDIRKAAAEVELAMIFKHYGLR